MQLNEVMEKIGIDADATLRRFSGNEALLKRFLGRFAADPTYVQLTEAVSSGDKKGVEMTAHTMKGVAANLGMEELSRRAAAMVADVRNNDGGNISELFKPVEEEYQRVAALLAQLEG